MQIEAYTRHLADGRTLAWAEAGKRDGSPVFSFHGLPGSRFQQHPDEGVARNRGIRLIHVERPGFGLSSPKPRRTLADWPRDVAALADALGIRRFAVLGISGGGPYALACAAALGDRVTRVAVVSGVGPPGSMNGAMNLTVRMAFLLAAHAPWLLRPALWTGAQIAIHLPQRFLDTAASHMSAADQPILARPEVRAMFERDLAAAFAQGPGAMLHDLKLLATAWKLPLERIACPVMFWHGTDDRMIPDGASRVLSQSVQSGELTLVEGQGHYMVFDLWPEIVDWLAEESGRTESPSR